MIDRAAVLNPKIEHLDRGKIFQRLLGQLRIARAFGGLMLSSVDFKKVMKGNRFLRLLRFVGGMLIGRGLKEQMRRHTNVPDGVAVTILPFEELHSVESERLAHCTAGFAYVDPDTEQVGTVPFCTWGLYRTAMFRKIADKYEAEKTEQAGATA